MPLLELRKVSLSYSQPPLLDSISIMIEKGERICLIGKNGEGKTTLLKIIFGELLPDSGKRILLKDLQLAYLQQDLNTNLEGNIFDIVADGYGNISKLLKDYEKISTILEIEKNKKNLDKLMDIQEAIESLNGWEIRHQVNEVLTKMELNSNEDFSSLSGGMKRRVLLAQALIKNPDLLILDEPTNHLDIESICWLEKCLIDWKGAVIFITHDRNFLKKISTRIIELNNGKIKSYACTYNEYLRRRSDFEHSKNLELSRFNKKLSKEESWIRQGVKARRARNEGRVRKLSEMRKKAAERRRNQHPAKLKISIADRPGNLICEIIDASFSWGKRNILKNFSVSIQHGEKIGIVGPNGCGKTTLINLILGVIKPDKGQIKTGTKIEIAYFDQQRESLNYDATVIDNISNGASHVEINGKRRHVIGYLGDFLFPPKKCLQPIKSLSGGEINRLVLAKIFSYPVNVLILDEPTNDLDLETLELLEELLIDFSGTIFLVSHDREFLDNVVTSLIVFDHSGGVYESIGGYKDWELYQKKIASKKIHLKEEFNKQKKINLKKKNNKKLSYKDQVELDNLPKNIENLEIEQKKIQEIFSDSELYSLQGAEKLKQLSIKLKEIDKTLETYYQRWEDLEL